MQNDNDREPRDRDRQNGGAGGDGGFNWKGIVLLSIALGLIALALMARTSGGAATEVPYQKFKELVETGKIHIDEKITPQPRVLQIVQRDNSKKQYVTGWYEVEDPSKNNGEKYARFRTPIILDFAKDDLEETLAKADLKIYDQSTEEDSGMATLLSFYLPLLLLIFLLYLLFRHQIRMAGKGAMSFGKSKAKMLAMDKNKITFKDVAGVEEAKEEVWEIVEFLKDPKKFQRLGGRIPKGVLMVGSPGTGKTLLARAIAGEADVPFFSISGSDFVEMFVGVGASRVRDMFEQGKKNAPCLIFIDEIDAVGRHRGHGHGGGHDEREQTLNALLVEMDGFDTQEGVIIIAATNRPDVLDPALLRPGRFDRQITVSLPDVNGREEILRVHAKKVKIADGVDLGVIARGTPGYSGAELANVINEAALLAARKGLKAITLPEFEEARDKVRWGKERRSLAISEKDKEKTAYHEAGHAILLVLLENTDPLHKVTIIPRGPSLGSTMWLPEQDKYTQRKCELLDQLVVAMGGRVAEEIVFHDIASGASGDIRQATAIARKMVCEWGMSEELGMIEYGDHSEQSFMGMGAQRSYSEATAQKIDAEVKKLIDDAYAKATELIIKHRDKVDAIAEALLEFETLDAKHIGEIMEFGELRNPPSRPTPPDLPAAPVEKPEPVIEKAKPDEDELPGGLAPAGA
ncbi:MAG: ATP-dependent zinc metalloprotease FtsH [Verrucomicrobiae bacterium]|nr:ATP-dependent zinc metalloprotease FtsH [Verrucomicrobiae bacterium]